MAARKVVGSVWGGMEAGEGKAAVVNQAGKQHPITSSPIADKGEH